MVGGRSSKFNSANDALFPRSRVEHIRSVQLSQFAARLSHGKDANIFTSLCQFGRENVGIFVTARATTKVVPQPLPQWEKIDGKLHALAAEKQITRKQTLREFLMGEVPNIVTYEVDQVDKGFMADVQVGDLHFHSAHPAASEEEAKRSAAVAALWELQWQPAPKPSRKRVANDHKRLRGHFRFHQPNEHIKQVMIEHTLHTF